MKPEVNYALFNSAGICIWVLVEYLLGFHSTRMEIGQYTGYLANVIPITMLFLAIRERREKLNGGTLTFGQGMKTGIIISLITAVITTIFMYVYLTAVNPEFMNLGMELQKQKLLQSGHSEAEVTASLESMKTMYSLPFQLGAILVITPIVGSVYSAIISAILRKKPVQPSLETKPN